MELLKQEKSKNDFLISCEKYIKEHLSKNITGECENCFLLYIKNKLDFKASTENNYNYTDCNKIASFLQDAGQKKKKNGIANESKTTYIDCDKFSFLNSFGKNKI